MEFYLTKSLGTAISNAYVQRDVSKWVLLLVKCDTHGSWHWVAYDSYNQCVLSRTASGAIPNTDWTSMTVYDFESVVSTVLRATWQKTHGVILCLASSIWEANSSVQANLSQSMLGATMASLQLIGSALLTACNLLISMAASPTQHVKRGMQHSRQLTSPISTFLNRYAPFLPEFQKLLCGKCEPSEFEALQSCPPHLLPYRGEKERIKLWHLLISH